MRIVICDDDCRAGGEMETILMQYGKGMRVEMDISVFTSADTLSLYLRENSCDLIFLDIEMPGMNGVELGRYIRRELSDHITKIVYVSGKDCYDRQLFDVQPMLFIEKPVEKERVAEAVSLAMKLMREVDKAFVYTKGREQLRIAIKDIVYFECLNHEVRIVTVNGEDVCYSTLDKIVSQLENARFIPIHRSYLVNYDQVRNIRFDEFVMSDGSTLPVSRPRRKDVRETVKLFGLEGIR